jgi:hypothetical protein
VGLHVAILVTLNKVRQLVTGTCSLVTTYHNLVYQKIILLSEYPLSDLFVKDLLGLFQGRVFAVC